MSYAPEETNGILNDKNIEVISSVHKILKGSKSLSRNRFGSVKNNSKINRKIKGEYYNFSEKLIIKFRSKVLKVIKIIGDGQVYLKYLYYRKNFTSLSLYEYFENSDLFILAGGGYLNSWKESVYSHSLEIFITHKLGIKSLCLGQSIGPFNSEHIKRLTYSSIKLCHLINVRDKLSSEELKENNISNVVVPDVALVDNNFTSQSQNRITVIVRGSLGKKQINSICNAIHKVSLAKNLGVKILITRIWEGDLRKAFFVKNILSNLGLANIDFVIPKDIFQLQQEIIGSSVVVSVNMHALILAWRVGIPIVCIESARKFKSFLEQTEQLDKVISFDDLNEQILTDKILESLDSKVSYNLRENISNIIVSEYNNCFEFIEKPIN